ncbi:MAG: hypothetical protein RLZ10_105 [Bacteroidota bacterium]|jgi:hypothetical protein
MRVHPRIILSVITVAAYDLDRLKTTLNSYIGAPNTVEFILVYPANDIKTQTYLSKFMLDNNLRITIVHDLGIGVYPAMNLGSKVSMGTYLMFWNAGDSCLSTEELLNFTKYLEFNKPVWGFTQANFNWRDPQELTLHNVKNFVLQRGGYLSHQTHFVRKSDFIYLKGFDENYKVAADYKLIAQLWQVSEPSFSNFVVVNIEFPNFSARNNRVGRFENLKILFQVMSCKFIIPSLYFILLREFNYLLNRILKIFLRFRRG